MNPRSVAVFGDEYVQCAAGVFDFASVHAGLFPAFQPFKLGGDACPVQREAV